jgi:putative ABC transport system permease protein
MDKFANYAINGVGDEFFSSQNLELSSIAEGYQSADQVWRALSSDPSLVVVDSFSVDRTGDPTFQAGEDTFMISSIKASDTTFDPVEIQITAADGSQNTFKVIGVLATAPSFYGAMMNTEAAQNLGYFGSNRYFLRLSADADVQADANAIEANFNRSGVQTSLLKEELRDSRSSINSIFYLIQGFIGLGLLVGIAALGVVTIRAVVERRQQIGVLRAIGFQRSMVQGIFLFESLFIAGLGVVIGFGLAITFAYNLYLQVAADQGLPFLPPWVTLAAIAASILVASLITAWLPARSTSKIVIAEALRYE